LMCIKIDSSQAADMLAYGIPGRQGRGILRSDKRRNPRSVRSVHQPCSPRLCCELVPRVGSPEGNLIMEQFCSIYRYKRLRSRVVLLGPAGEEQIRRAVMTISCYECGAAVEFFGVRGEGVMLSPDRRQLSLTITAARQGTVRE
jgi:hypothetical protein